MENEIEQVETVPDGGVAMRLVQAPDGRLYAVPAEGEATISDAAITEDAAPSEASEAATESLFGWAQPILDDPLGWAEANLLNLEVLLPIAWQVGAIFGVLIVGAMFAPKSRSLIN